MVDELFSKRLPINLKSSDREERKLPIQISIEIQHNTTLGNKKELVLRLTDDKDLFFLYTLHISEEDFQCLKTQQGLLMDFSAFPQKFIDLLQQVLQEEHKETPKFILDLVFCGSSANSLVTLNVIETNPFKHLTHLALKLTPGSDHDIKKYLAGCLKDFKDTNETLHQKLSHTESKLSQELRQAREALSLRTSELEGLRRESAQQSDELSNKHQLMVNNEREKYLQSQQIAQQRFDKERRDLEQAHLSVVKHLEIKLKELDVANKDLTTKTHHDDNMLRELQSKLSSIEDESCRNKQEFQQLRQNNTALDSNHHEQEKLINQLKIRLAVVEQEVRDKEELNHKTNDLLAAEKEHKRGRKPVPMLIPKDTWGPLEFLIDPYNRKQARIADDNPYIFANTGEGVHRGYDALKQIVSETTGLKSPDRVLCTNTRILFCTMIQYRTYNVQIHIVCQRIKSTVQLLHKPYKTIQDSLFQNRSDEDLARKQRQVGKLEVSIKTVGDELIKANQIIKKCQGEIRNYHAKLKLRNQVTAEQEKLLTEKNREMEEMRKDLESAKTSLREKSTEVEKLSSSLEKTAEKLDESKKLLKTNENVINWLNKQVTETQLNQRGPQVSTGASGGHLGAVGPFELMTQRTHINAMGITSSVGSYNRPHTPSIQSTAHPHYVPTVNHSTPVSGAPTPHTSGLGSGIKGQHSNLQQAQYTPPQIPPSGIPQPIGKSSPHNGTTRSTNGTNSEYSENCLDAKYLQRSADPPLFTSNKPTSINFGSSQLAGVPRSGPQAQTLAPHNKNHAEPPSGTQTGPPNPFVSTASNARLNKDLIAPRTLPSQPTLTQPRPANAHQSTHPPLVSSYFPSKGQRIT